MLTDYVHARVSFLPIAYRQSCVQVNISDSLTAAVSKHSQSKPSRYSLL